MRHLHDWQTSFSYEEPKGQTAPVCPECGDKLRRDDSSRDAMFPGVAYPPWNAGWDGTCGSCNHRFEAIFSALDALDEQVRQFFRIERTVKVRPCNRPFRTGIDDGHVLSGVEITVTEKQYSDSTGEQTVFLGMAELRYLFEALKGELAVCQEQFDWTCDWT